MPEDIGPRIQLKSNANSFQVDSYCSRGLNDIQTYADGDLTIISKLQSNKVTIYFMVLLFSVQPVVRSLCAVALTTHLISNIRMHSTESKE